MKEEQEKYNLPEGWAIVTLRDILLLEYGKSLPKESRQDGKYPVFGSNGIIGYHNEFLLNGPVIVIGRKGSVGSVHISKESCWPIDTTYYIKTFPSLDLKFTYYALKYLNLSQLDNSTTIPGLNREKVYRKNIGLPTFSEQKVVVSQIDVLYSKLDEAEKGLKTANNSLKIYRQALLKDAFQGRLTKNWRSDFHMDAYQELTDIKNTRKDKYDSEIKNKKGKKITIDFQFDYKRDSKIATWAVASLDNLININARIGWRGLTKKEYTNEGALFLSVHSLNYGKNVVFKDANFISIERYEESPEIQLKENDILLCKDGAGIGKVGIIKKLPALATVNSSLLVIDGREVFNPDFLYYFFLGPDIQCLVNGKIAGSAIPHLFQKDIKKFMLKVPPKIEQDKIVEMLEFKFTLVDNLEKTVDNVLNEIIALKHSILKKAFEGKLVKYTSNESIEKMLNNIKEEKKLYLKLQKELNLSKPKEKKKMEEKKSILDILKESNSPMSAQELWERSTSKGDIEEFYSEIKEIYHEIDELKSKTESLLTLKDESK